MGSSALERPSGSAVRSSRAPRRYFLSACRQDTTNHCASLDDLPAKFTSAVAEPAPRPFSLGRIASQNHNLRPDGVCHLSVSSSPPLSRNPLPAPLLLAASPLGIATCAPTVCVTFLFSVALERPSASAVRSSRAPRRYFLSACRQNTTDHFASLDDLPVKFTSAVAEPASRPATFLLSRLEPASKPASSLSSLGRIPS